MVRMAKRTSTEEVALALHVVLFVPSLHTWRLCSKKAPKQVSSTLRLSGFGRSHFGLRLRMSRSASWYMVAWGWRIWRFTSSHN